MSDTEDPILLGEKPCENTFERWAKEEPVRLLAYLTRGTGGDARLSTAAECAKHAATATFASTLVDLLKHESTYVREGALLGLYGQIRLLLDTVGNVSRQDKSDCIRATARDVLDELADDLDA